MAIHRKPFVPTGKVMQEQQRFATRLTITNRERKDDDGGPCIWTPVDEDDEGVLGHGIGHKQRPQALRLRAHVQFGPCDESRGSGVLSLFVPCDAEQMN